MAISLGILTQHFQTYPDPLRSIARFSKVLLPAQGLQGLPTQCGNAWERPHASTSRCHGQFMLRQPRHQNVCWECLGDIFASGEILYISYHDISWWDNLFIQSDTCGFYGKMAAESPTDGCGMNSSMEPSHHVEMARVAMAEGLGRAGLVYRVPV